MDGGGAGVFRAKWPDPDNAKGTLPALGRSVQMQAQAFMHLKSSARATEIPGRGNDNFTTGRRAAEAAAERIRAYWARQGQTVRWN